MNGVSCLPAVRQDRAPGGRHRHASLQDHKQKKPKLASKPCKSASLDVDLTCNQGEEQYVEESETSDEYMEIIEQMTVNVAVIPESPIPDTTDETDGNQLDVNRLMQSGYRELYEVIQWSKTVPGFKELCLEDQMTLLKTSFMDLNVFRLAYRSIPCDPTCLRFNDKVICDAETCINMGWSKDLTTTTLEFCGKLRNLNIDVNEFACLSGLVLLSPGKYTQVTSSILFESGIEN